MRNEKGNKETTEISDEIERGKFSLLIKRIHG